MNDNSPVALFDDIGQDGEGRRQTSISMREDVDVRAFRPTDIDRGVNGFLDVCAVEV